MPFEGAPPAECYFCRRHAEAAEQPPGGWILVDDEWFVGHGGPESSQPGRVIIESRRHFLDFSEMTDEEAASFGRLLRRLYGAIREVTAAERVHLIATMDYVPHFHAWLCPRPVDEPRRGPAFLAQPASCSPEEAVAAAGGIRDVLAVSRG